ncbi:MAG: hypothetical protein JXQ71_06240 [Verrucomicrobia bacterium]|nr:hypothetical protein [Verrucomicrobiota bacterium]
MKTRNLLICGLSTLVCTLGAPPTAQAGCTTIDFEDQAVGSVVTTDYPGVTFSVLPQTCGGSPILYMRIANPAGNGTSSGTRCLRIPTGCPDFSDDYLRMVFAAPQSKVTFTLGDYTGTYHIRYYTNTTGSTGKIGEFDPEDPRDAKLDTDGDGASNLEEYLAGTDPRDKESVLRITDITTNTDGTLVTWTTVGSHHYLLQNGTNLTSGIDTDVSPLISVPPGGTGTTNYLHTDGTAAPASFYRVREVP